MKLTGYYMTAVAKTELGITDIIVFDVKTRAELVKRLNEEHPDVCRLYDFERHPFKLDMKPGRRSGRCNVGRTAGTSVGL